MEKIKIHQNIQSGEEVWTGIPGKYITAPEEEGTYSFYELAYRNEDGQLVHDDYEFVMEEPDPNFGKNRYVPEVEDEEDEGWEE